MWPPHKVLQPVPLRQKQPEPAGWVAIATYHQALLAGTISGLAWLCGLLQSPVGQRPAHTSTIELSSTLQHLVQMPPGIKGCLSNSSISPKEHDLHSQAAP